MFFHLVSGLKPNDTLKITYHRGKRMWSARCAQHIVRGFIIARPVPQSFIDGVFKSLTPLFYGYDFGTEARRDTFIQAMPGERPNPHNAAQMVEYLRANPIERHFRELQAARFHPGQPYAQREFAGRLALGLDVDAA